jgi:hypothetical protein
VCRYLIDPRGTVWTHPAHGLGEALGYPEPDFDVWSYAVRNLGAVEITVGPEETVVSMRTATAHARAVAAAERFLAENLGPQPVRLRYEIGAWIEETCEGPGQAVGRLASALADAARESRRVAFAAKARNIDMLAEYRLNKIETPDERFSLLFKKWRLARGVFDSDTANFLVRFGLIDRTFVVGESASDRSLVFEHVGLGFHAYDSYDQAWAFSTNGVPIANQPDPDYGRWIDRTYRNVLIQREPRFDYVDAVIQARGGEPYRSRYDRLLLPWQSVEGRGIVTGISYQAQALEPALSQ